MVRRLRPRLVRPERLGAVLADIITALQYLDTSSGPNESIIPSETMARLDAFQLEMVFQREEEASDGDP